MSATAKLDNIASIKAKMQNELKGTMDKNYQNLKNKNKTDLQNLLYDAILKDYEKYYADIKSEKDKQLGAFTNILTHLENLNNKFSPNINGTILQNDLANIKTKITEINNAIGNIPTPTSP